MADPPPYSAADTPFILTCLPEYIHYRDYPKLCLVSSSWRDVFQSLLWSQPDRYFSTQNRSSTGTSLSLLHPFSLSLFLLKDDKLMLCFSRIPQVHSSILLRPAPTPLPYNPPLPQLNNRVPLHHPPSNVPLPSPPPSPLPPHPRPLPGFLISYPHIAQVTSFHHELSTLSLAGCQAFSSTAILTQFLSYFPNLRRLDLSATMGVSPQLFGSLVLRHLTSVRMRHQPFKITDDTIITLSRNLESNLSDLDLSFSLKSITSRSLLAIEQYCQARPPLYSSSPESVDIGPGPRKLGIAYTSIPISSISHFVNIDMIHLTSLDIAGLPNIPNSSVQFWESLHHGGSFSTLQKLRLDFSVFATNAGFNITFLPTRLTEFTLHNVPSVESTPPRVTRVLTMLFTDLIPPTTTTTNSFIQARRGYLRVVNLEMAPKEDEQVLGMYGIEERDMGDEIDVIEEVKRWKRSQKRVWDGEIRVIRDVVGVRGYAQEFGSGVGDILGRWLTTDDV